MMEMSSVVSDASQKRCCRTRFCEVSRSFSLTIPGHRKDDPGSQIPTKAPVGWTGSVSAEPVCNVNLLSPVCAFTGVKPPECKLDGAGEDDRMNSLKAIERLLVSFLFCFRIRWPFLVREDFRGRGHDDLGACCLYRTKADPNGRSGFV
jgi:hypothetical protein